MGVVGHRQVGKTTLTSLLSSLYVTLDVGHDLAQALVDPLSFLATHVGNPATIDECQLAPPLFPALKEWVRINKKPGQFLLTGSVRFTSRKAIRESLTGRIITWELLPMDWSEQCESPLPDSLIRLLKSRDMRVELSTRRGFSPLSYRRYLEMGGFPGVFGVRDPAIRSQRFETQINTILERDLQLLIQTSLDFKTLRRLLVALAKGVSEPLAIALLSRETRISLPTLRKLLAAFESSYLIRLIPSEGDFSKPVLFFEDLGEQNHLIPTDFVSVKQLTCFLFQNLRVQFHYRPELKGEIFSYRSRSGTTVPLCFRVGKDVLGIIPIISEDELATAHRDARHFLKQYPSAKTIIVSLEDRDQFLSPGVRWLGVGRLI